MTKLWPSAVSFGGCTRSNASVTGVADEEDDWDLRWVARGDIGLGRGGCLWFKARGRALTESALAVEYLAAGATALATTLIMLDSVT
jgi:hypothetical protein